MSERNQEKALSTAQMLMFGALILFVVLAIALLARKYVMSPDPVSDSEARAFITKLEGSTLNGSTSPCRYAGNDDACRRTLAHRTAPLLQRSEIVCTWEIPETSGSRAVELNNVGVDREPFRSTVFVYRDLGDLYATWVPYWEKSHTRPVPGPDAEAPAELTNEISTEWRDDPCLHPDAIK